MDLVIRGGTVFDGTGSEGRVADVGVKDGIIVQVGGDVPAGREEIDATGKIVTPGFVDIHTHYDGQAIWDSRLAPSSDHGVTTVLTGNCGVGFAPCRPDDHDILIELMAGVEDIPEVVMAEGLPWNWESYPEFLDVVEQRPHDIDVASMFPHSALRVYVMGERAIRREAATPEDIAEMARLTREAIRAGSLGFGTSRNLQQVSIKGESIPSVRAGWDELEALAKAMADEGQGVFQILCDFNEYDGSEIEFARLRDIVEKSGRPMCFSLQQKHYEPNAYREVLGLLTTAAAEGVPIKAQVAARASGVLLGHQLSMHPFLKCPSYIAIAGLPLAERVAAMQEPARRRAIIAEAIADTTQNKAANDFARMFPLTDTPDYEPRLEDSVEAIATARGVSPEEYAYDYLLQDGGEAVLFGCGQNYAEGDLRASEEMISHPETIVALGDGGAHLGLICDASYTTTMLAHWARDRSRGRKMPLAWAINQITRQPAAAVGLNDRGVIAPGYKADLNVIDFDRLRLRKPTVVFDLPEGGRRILQKADGYEATIVSGVVVYREGEPTGALPGRLVRGAQAPAALAA